MKLTYPILSDHPDLQTIRRYGVLWPHQIGPHPPNTAARRSFFLIDKQGIVRGRWLPEDMKATFSSEPILRLARDIVGQR